MKRKHATDKNAAAVVRAAKACLRKGFIFGDNDKVFLPQKVRRLEETLARLDAATGALKDCKVVGE